MRKVIIRIILVALLSVVIEVLVIQGKNIVSLVQLGDKANKEIHMDAFEYVNWEQNNNGEFVSLEDPILVYDAGNLEIRNISIHVDSPDTIPYIDVFYTNDLYHDFADHYFRCAEINNNSALISINDHVRKLRFDLGDEEGLVVRDITCVLNHARIKISLSRIIAINLIYWATCFLFSLQKMPDYGIDKKMNNTQGKEELES